MNFSKMKHISFLQYFVSSCIFDCLRNILLFYIEKRLKVDIYMICAFQKWLIAVKAWWKQSVQSNRHPGAKIHFYSKLNKNHIRIDFFSLRRLICSFVSDKCNHIQITMTSEVIQMKETKLEIVYKIYDWKKSYEYCKYIL